MEELINVELMRVQKWLTSQAKNDKWNFKLYTIPYNNVTVTHKHFRANNFDSTNSEEAMAFLRDAILLYGPDSDKRFVIRNIISPTDNKHRDFYFANPLFNPMTQKGLATLPAITGYGQNSQANMFGLLEQERRHNSEIQDLKDKIRNLEHQKDLDELKEEIAAIRHDNRNTMDKIQGFAESSIGQTLIGAILAQLNSKMAQPSESNQVGNQEHTIQEPKQEAQPQTDNEQPIQNQEQAPEPNEQIEKINTAIYKLEQVFPKEVATALLDLAIYCENNPDQAKTLRNLAKTTTNEH